MQWSWLFTNLVSAFLLPPLNLLLLGAFGHWRLQRHPRQGRILIGLSLAGLWLLGTPWIATELLNTLVAPHRAYRGDEAEAIVILGGGARADAPEYGGDTPNSRSLERLRYGAWLHRRTGQPILVSGGGIGEVDAEGKLMREALEQEFRVPVRWSEERSTNTRENARYSAELLRAEGIRRIYLVSHVWHLPRAVVEFEREGFVVLPAGTGYPAAETSEPMGLFDFLPTAHSLVISYYAFHEWVGMAWYRFLSWLTPA
jgi:uncharacterized SAM-binding protein YcdF (DUF218 family)